MDASVTMLISVAGPNSGFVLGKRAHNSTASIQKRNTLMVLHGNNTAALEILGRNDYGLRLTLEIVRDSAALC